MKTILVYEDGNVNEYELNYDQEYMDIRLEEYKKTFALLRKGRVFVDSASSKEDLRKVTGCIDEFVSIRVSGTTDENILCINFIGAINPTVYNILNNGDGFTLDNSRIYALYAWYQAIKDSPVDSDRDLSLASFDYYNLDEKTDLNFNISLLLSDVTLSYVGKKDIDRDDDVIKARRNSIFIKEFGIQKEFVKQLKK